MSQLISEMQTILIKKGDMDVKIHTGYITGIDKKEKPIVSDNPKVFHIKDGKKEYFLLGTKL